MAGSGLESVRDAHIKIPIIPYKFRIFIFSAGAIYHHHHHHVGVSKKEVQGSSWDNVETKL